MLFLKIMKFITLFFKIVSQQQSNNSNKKKTLKDVFF